MKFCEYIFSAIWSNIDIFTAWNSPTDLILFELCAKRDSTNVDPYLGSPIIKIMFDFVYLLNSSFFSVNLILLKNLGIISL